MSCQFYPGKSLPYLCERLESRRLLSAAVQYVSQAPDGTLSPVNFNVDLASSGASVQQFTATQRSLLQSGVATSNAIYLRLDGVTGESVEVSHIGQIPVQLFNWVQNGAAITSGGGKGSPPQTNAIHFVTEVSRASPQLMGSLLAGAPIPTADLSVNKPTAAGLAEFYHVHLENVRVGSYQLLSENALQEEFTLVFQKATISYIPQIPGVPLQYQIDTAALGAAAAPFQPVQNSLLQGSINPYSGSEFLRLDGIAGESTAVGHVGQIGVESFGFATTASGAAGKANYSSIHVLAPLSLASPKLMQATASGPVIPTADLYVVSPSGVDTYDIHLIKVIVSSYKITTAKSSGDELPDEEFTLSFAGLTIDYHYQPPGQTPQVIQFADEAPSVMADPLAPQSSLLDTSFQPSAQSMYVRLDGVSGGMVVAGQPNELPALAYSWGTQGPEILNGTAAGPTHFEELHFVTPVSKASPQIESLVASGTLVPTADFIIIKPSAASPFYHIHLQNVFVTSYHLSTAHDGQLEDEFTLAFTKVTVDESTPTTPGGPGTTVEFQRDLTQRGDLLDEFTPVQPALLDQGFTPIGESALLSIAGIPGDSVDARHPKAIVIDSFSTGLNTPRDPQTGQPAGKRQFQPIHFISSVSSASPLLMNALASGQVLTTADLYVAHPGVNPVDYYTIHLDNVRIISDQIRPGPDGADEEFSLSYSGIGVTYVEQNPAGGEISVKFSENLQASQDAIAGFTPPQQSLFTAPTSSDGLFLTVAGVKGPSTDAAHPGSIELLSWGWGSDLPLDPNGSGAVAGPPQFQVLHALSPVSEASPQLMQLATTGQDISTVELDARHAGATTDYYVLRLTDARVSSYQVKQGGSLLEEFTLSFRKIQVLTLSNSVTKTQFTYDLSANNAGVSDFIAQQASLADNGYGTSSQQMFLSLPGIPGDSTDSVHHGQIVVDSFTWGESVSGRVVFDELHVVAPLSIASPLISRAVLTGIVIPTADLYVRRPSINPFDFYTIHLDNVQITSQQIATGPDGSEVEEFTLHFGGGPGSIAGHVFNDANHNGVQDAGETGLAGITVYLDLNHDGMLDPTDPTAVSDSSGTYTFTDLVPGSYTVRQAVPSGYALTAPLGYAGAVTVSTNQTAAGPTFGDTQLSTVILNFAYLVLLARHYGHPATFATGDLNGDGIVNFDDLVLLARHYQRPLI